MPDKNARCLFHADRLKFEHLERELKQSKWIPRRNCHRLASAICSCRKHLDWQPNEEELTEHVICFRAILQNQDQSISSHLTIFVNSILDTVTAADYSKCCLLKILLLAQNGDLSFFTRQTISNNIVKSVELNKKEETPPKVSEKQYEYMMQKTNKGMEPEVVEISVFPRSVKKLERKLGSNHVNYSKKGRFIYEIKHQINKRNFNDNVNIYTEIWSKHCSALHSVESCLKQIAMETQQQAESFKARKRQRNKYDRNCLDAESDSELYDEGLKIKNIRGRDFEMKVQKQEKYTERKKVKKSVLDGGHCFHCLEPFTCLKNVDSCIYHPGFLLSGKWSCCGNTPYDVHDMENEHSIFGCAEGQHIWRTHKKANRKPKRGLHGGRETMV